MWQRFWAVLKARNLEFIRDRSTLIWNILFPIMLIGGFAVIFGNTSPVFRVGVVSTLDAYVSLPSVTRLEQVGTIPYADQEQALSALRRHQLHMVLDLDSRLYWINETRFA
ncbi:MAG: hypothetical protein WED11_01435 [Natronospirillum sp.]